LASHSLKSASKRLRKAQERLQAQTDAPCYSIRLEQDGAARPPSDQALKRYAAPAKAPHVCGQRCVVVAVQLATGAQP
jgi:hypothetical protein